MGVAHYDDPNQQVQYGAPTGYEQGPPPSYGYAPAPAPDSQNQQLHYAPPSASFQPNVGSSGGHNKIAQKGGDDTPHEPEEDI